MANQPIDLSGLSIEELQSLRGQLDDRIVQLQEETVRKAFEQMEQVAAGVGMSLKELVDQFGPKSRGKSRGKRVAVKFRNPENREETWTGKGRKPNWIDREVSAGRRLEDFAV